MLDFTVTSMATSANVCTSPITSSLDSVDLDQEEEANIGQSDIWHQQHQQQHQSSPNNVSQQQTHVTIPLQKRRRVTRACDECRRKKIKCDGKQPCTHCTVYNYDCTYDQPSNRRRNPTPQYIEALENRLRRAEALLNSTFPNFDPNDPNIDKFIQQRSPGQNDEVEQFLSGKNMEIMMSGPGVETESKLRSMIESTGQLDLDESGNWDFHGESSGAVFVRRMQENFGGLLVDEDSPLFPRTSIIDRTQPHEPPNFLPENLCNPGSFKPLIDLPPRETTEALCEIAFNRACSLLHFIHIPTFYEMLDRIYELPTQKFEEIDHRFLALLFFTLALGCMFNDDSIKDSSETKLLDINSKLDEGFKYFRHARKIIDIMDCRHIIHLQAIIFMILFLQSSTNLSACYSYIGIAQRAALQMGLHRNLADKFNPIERETRRRVFWVIRKMDICVSAMLGFPELLSHDDIDQEMPIEIDDEYITKTEVLPVPGGKLSLPLQAANAHTRLMLTLAKVIKYIYPTKSTEEYINSKSTNGFLISHSKIREIEKDLTEWLENLPMNLRPGGDEKIETIRAQQFLRLSYAHVQMMLYRPFLFHVSKNGSIEKNSTERSFACAAACINVSRNIVHITSEMKRRGLLIGTYWLTMYTTYFAILSLVYFVLENTDASGSPEILRDANSGRETLNELGQKSHIAQRCSTALKSLFEKLPENLKNSNLTWTISNKKRLIPLPNTNKNNANNCPINNTLFPNSNTNGLVLEANRSSSTPAIISTSSVSQKLLDQNVGFHTSPISEPNFKQQKSDDSPPPRVRSSGTRASMVNRQTNGIHQQQNYPSQQFGMNYAIQGLDSEIFSPTDPFEYPNQPILDFGNLKNEPSVAIINSGSSHPPMFLHSSHQNGDQVYHGLGSQLLRSMPLYLTPGHHQNGYCTETTNLGSENLINSHLNQGIGFHSGGLSHHTAEIPNSLDLYSTDGEAWNEIVHGQRYGP